MKSIKWLSLAISVGMLAIWASTSVRSAHAEASPKGDPERGQYIFGATIGCGCHGPNLAGYKSGNPATMPASAPFGERFDGPFGSVPTTNITPDRETGIGGWSDAEIIAAIRIGVRPDSSPLFPIMPYPSYSGMADQDVRDLVSYLRTVPAVKNEVPAKKLNPPPPGVQPPPPPPLQKAPENAPTSPPERRGEYIARSLAHCDICHSTMAPDMTPVPDHYTGGQCHAHRRRVDRGSQYHAGQEDGHRLLEQGGDREISEDRDSAGRRQG